MKKQTAFSLIELSIVILIIGILVAGITQSSRLVKQFRLKTAQTLTQSSPVHSIKDLMLWYETSMEGSIAESEAVNGLPVSTWYDYNKQNVNKINATSSSSARPFYTEDAINSLPVLRFDGSDDLLNFDGSQLIASAYTVFIVEQRRAALGSTDSPLMGGTTGSGRQNLHILYRDETTFNFSDYANDLGYSIGSYTVPTPRIHTCYQSTVDGRKYWLNGGTSADSADDTLTDTLTSYTASALGRYHTRFFNGDIAEVIIFTRALKKEERQAVETYLSKKYNIKITG